MGNTPNKVHMFDYLDAKNIVVRADNAVALHDMWDLLGRFAKSKGRDEVYATIDASHDTLEEAGRTYFATCGHTTWLPISFLLAFFYEQYKSAPAVLTLINEFPILDFKQALAKAWFDAVTQKRAKLAAKLEKADALLCEIKEHHPSF